MTSTLPAAVVRLDEKVKPKYRGTSHAVGFVFSLAGIYAMSVAPVTGWRFTAGIVYAVSLALMLGLSALYHKPMWSLEMRSRLRMADHIGVFLLIAGSYTPLAALVSPSTWTWGLLGMWVGNLGGIAYSSLNNYGPRWIRAGLYVVLGLCALPMLLSLPPLLGWVRVSVMLVSSAIYILGAVVYARRWPNPNPAVFGYHEVMHLMVLVCAAMQFGVLWTVQQQG
ncbi:MAG: PAQR family membrane homeostasis protein TrhA [Archangium sp.]